MFGGFRAVGWLVVLAAASAPAQTVYRWTDERGVVHFADVPPPDVRGYTTESMPIAPPRPTPAAAVEPQDEAPASGSTSTGPAKLVVVEHDERPIGDATVAYSGKVKNEGGAAAEDVMVAIRVIEPTQGDECLDDQIDVHPGTLGPGESGTFEAEYTNPCFKGPTRTELQVEWD
jgi:hypothetical protein